MDLDAHLEHAAVERDRARQFLKRASWAVAALLAAMAVCVWLISLERRAVHLEMVGYLSSAFAAGLFSFIALVWLLRRRLSAVIERLAADHELLFAQNKRLAQQNIDLERQAEILSTQSAELRRQSAVLEERTRALELADRRANEAQRVAMLGYWEVDSKSGEVYWSDEMYRIAGLDPGIRPAPTDQYLNAVHPDDRPLMEQVAVNAIQSLSEFTQQYRIRDANNPTGPMRVVQATGRVIIDDRGDRKLVGTVQDVTNQVQLETQLRRAQKMEALGQLAGGVSHDFNNVLTVIESYAGMLIADCRTSPEVRSNLEEIRSAGRRAASLTRQLLAFSRQQMLRPRVLDINDAIGDVESMLRRLIGENIEFLTQLSPDLDLVKADPTQIEQVLVNLVVNARDAVGEHGTITIETANVQLDESATARRSTHAPGPYVMLAVSDTGCGIPPELLERIFEPFFSTKDIGRGTGLGLSTVHGIVEQSGGHVWVCSEPDVGTTFKVYLPRATPAERASTGIARHISSGSNETILLVEDDVSVRKVTVALLRRAGFSVLEATNGAEAMKLIERNEKPIDLVITDMVMPVMGGRALAARMERLRPRVPVLLMSGYTRDATSTTAEVDMGDGFIEKPFAPDLLVGKIREVLDGRSQE